MLFRESTGNYGKINKKHGYVGGYQFGGQALETLGYLRKGAYEAAKKKYGNGNKALTNSINWTGKNKIKSLNDFIKNPEAQDKAFEENLNFNFKSLKQKGVINQGTPLSIVAGYLAASHLIGTEKIAKEGLSAKDANKVTGSEYFQLGQSAVTTPELAKEEFRREELLAQKTKETKPFWQEKLESIIPSANAGDGIKFGNKQGLQPSFSAEQWKPEAPQQDEIRVDTVDPEWAAYFDAIKAGNVGAPSRVAPSAKITEPIQVVPNVMRRDVPEVFIGTDVEGDTPQSIFRKGEIGKTFMGEPVAPENIWRDSSGNPILDRFGGYIYTEKY